MLLRTSVVKRGRKTPPLDSETRRVLRGYERFGAVFCVVCALFLRYAYELSGGEVWAIVFASVNGSPWEKTKALAVSYIFWGFVELACVRVPFKRFVVSKTAGLYMLLVVGCGLYTACGMFTTKIGAADVAILVLLTVEAHMISYGAAAYRHGAEKFFYIALVMLAVYYVAFAFLTAAHPNIFLFI